MKLSVLQETQGQTFSFAKYEHYMVSIQIRYFGRNRGDVTAERKQ